LETEIISTSTGRGGARDHPGVLVLLNVGLEFFEDGVPAQVVLMHYRIDRVRFRFSIDRPRFRSLSARSPRATAAAGLDGR
jgi:hypothetical protein